MDKRLVSCRNSAFQLHESRSPLVSGRSRDRPRFGYRSESRRVGRRNFFRRQSPLSGSRPYRKPKERDTRRIGPEKQLTFTSGPVEIAFEARSSRAGIPLRFGLEDRILMIPSGHRPRRCVVARYLSVSSVGLVPLTNGGSVSSVSMPWAHGMAQVHFVAQSVPVHPQEQNLKPI